MLRGSRVLPVLAFVASCGRLGFDPALDSASVDGRMGDSPDGTIGGPAIPGAVNRHACLISKPVGATNFDSYSLCVAVDARVLFYTATTAVQDYLYGPTVGLMSWHHLAITWDGTTKRGYIDGVEVISKQVAISGDSQPIFIGADFVGGAPQEPTTGRIDEVYAFPRALSGTEIAQLAM